MSTVWLHTHLPRLRAGDPNPVSLKVPGQRIAYTSYAVLKDARFVVNERGRQRCLAEGVRNVHAWVVGELVARADSVGPVERPLGARRALYDPFRGGTFVDSETLQPVTSAEVVIVSGKDVFYA